MGRYSYTQPSMSEDYYVDSSECGYSSTEELIRQDQEELSRREQEELNRREQEELNRSEPPQYPPQYPPQPEVEFGFPHICYCGGVPKLAMAKTLNNGGRLYYTCDQADDGECHVWKWWDVAVMEEMRARDRHVLQLSEKVDNLTLFSDFETEQKLVRLENLVCELGNKRSSYFNGFELLVGLLIIVLVFLGVVICFK